MSASVVRQTASRIAEHVRAHDLRSIELVLHGGEPLLVGVARLVSYVQVLRMLIPTTVHVTMQTNGLLLSEDTLTALAEAGVRIGVSVDGDREAHDRHRQRPDGRGSYDAVAVAVRALATRPDTYGGLLCTIDVRNDPVRTYEALLAFQPPAVDFLLPNCNWSDPPPYLGEYAGWLTAVFDRWYPSGETVVRSFEEIITVLLGGRSALEGVGTAVPASVVIETDGAIEISDMLSSAFEGAAATGLNIDSSSFDDAMRSPRITEYRRQALCDTCESCELREVCGGGIYAHRYREGSGFTNPSVYCADLEGLITHIKHRLTHDIAALPRIAR